MARKYIWELPKWPKFTWSDSLILESLSLARKTQGRILAKAVHLGIETQAQILVEDAQKTSAIEGDKLDLNSIRSSVARRLGLPSAGLPQSQRHVEGLIEMLLDATRTHEQPLTAKKLMSWQVALFPTGHSGLYKITTGAWRTSKEPMQVISGKMGHERIHFEAPPSKNIKAEMSAFIEWFNSSDKMDGLLRAAVSHLWFVTIHPFEDGNGRIARAITDMALAQDEKSQMRVYSLSSQIEKERDSYYEILERTQSHSLEITDWLVWFLNTFVKALESSEKIIDKTISISRFWQKNAQLELSTRQKKVLQKLLEAAPDGFVGGMTNRKYVSLTKVSKETAKRDLVDLEAKGLLKRNEGKGRSVSYALVTPE